MVLLVLDAQLFVGGQHVTSVELHVLGEKATKSFDAQKHTEFLGRKNLYDTIVLFGIM